MTLARRNGNLSNSFPSVFDDWFSRDLLDWNNSNFSNTGTTLPAINVKETPESFVVEMAAPGMKKEDFKVELNNNVLTISSEQKQNMRIKTTISIQEKNSATNLSNAVFNFQGKR